MHQPHVFLPQVLSLDVLILVTEVRKACGIPEPAKSVQILFLGRHGLGVWDLEAHTTLAQWFSGGKRGGDMDGYFSTIGGRILNSEVEVCTLGLGIFRRWFFIGGCWVAVLLAWIRVVVFRVLGSSVSGHARTVANLFVWSTRYSCYRCGCPRYFDVARVWQVHSGGQGKGGGVAGFHGQGVGGEMSGVRLVGALGRDQTYVSTVNPSYRKGNGRRGGAREVQGLALALEEIG